MSGTYWNGKGYYDPTAGEALKRAGDAEVRVKRERYRPLVYIVSPYAGDTDANTEAARKYCRFAVERGAIPVASHLLYPQFLDDGDPAERKLGLFFGKVLMDKCSEVWVFTDGAYSPGMKAEHDRAERKGVRIRYFTTDCREATDGGDGGGDGRI